jgi:hypothetical protein
LSLIFKMTLTDYLLIGLCVLVIAVGVLLYYHHIAVMDNLAYIRKSIGFQPQQQRYEPPPMPMRPMSSVEMPMRQMEMPMRPMGQMGFPMNLQMEVPPNSPTRDDSSSTESELQRQIEQYKRELEGVEDDLVFSQEDHNSTNDDDGSSVLNVEQEIDTVDLENAESELEQKVSQSNELKDSEVKTQDEKIMEHLNDLEDPSSQKDELMEKIINQEVKIESVTGEAESQITNGDNDQEVNIMIKKFSNEQLKEYCRTHGLLIKGGKKEMSKRLLGCKEFREELMLKGEL